MEWSQQMKLLRMKTEQQKDTTLLKKLNGHKMTYLGKKYTCVHDLPRMGEKIYFRTIPLAEFGWAAHDFCDIELTFFTPICHANHCCTARLLTKVIFIGRETA